MDSEAIKSQVAAVLQAEGVPSRKARAFNDVLLLSFIIAQGSDRPDFDHLFFVLMKANFFAIDKHQEHVPCVVCGQVPQTEWTALGCLPQNVGVHCEAHKPQFHSVCPSKLNCCEPYDPECDYQWRLNQPQE